MDFKHCRWSRWFDRDIAALPFPDGENMLTKTEAEKESVQKVRKKERTIHPAPLEQTEIYTHITYTPSHHTPNNSLRGTVYAVSDSRVWPRREKESQNIVSALS